MLLSVLHLNYLTCLNGVWGRIFTYISLQKESILIRRPKQMAFVEGFTPPSLVPMTSVLIKLHEYYGLRGRHYSYHLLLRLDLRNCSIFELPQLKRLWM